MLVWYFVLFLLNRSFIFSHSWRKKWQRVCFLHGLIMFDPCHYGLVMPSITDYCCFMSLHVHLVFVAFVLLYAQIILNKQSSHGLWLIPHSSADFFG
jgi:hypothetical protein